MTELSDELLVAYVDGQLARKQALAVDQVLAHDDVLAKRVAALKDAHGRLEAAFEAVLTGEEADAAAQPGRFGLRGMQERALAIGADVSIGGRNDGPGTSVRLLLPLPAAEARSAA